MKVNTPSPAIRRKTFSLRRIFLAPLIFAVITAGGLIFALVGDGVWDAVSWMALTLPIAAMAWHLRPGR